MLFGDTVDHDIHKRAVTDEVGREFVEIIGENANVLLDDGARRGVVFLCGMSGGNHIAISQVKPGSSNDDFSWFLRRALILVVLQDADCGLFRAQKRVLLIGVGSALSGAASIVMPAHAVNMNSREKCEEMR